MVVERKGDARAYPLRILIWHEIVNDVVGSELLAVTFCPLCNAAIAFRRRVGGRVLDFGTTGKLRYSDLVMYDRQTESWWQQMTGEAIVGRLTGTRLEPVPAQMASWRDFAQAHPRGRVLNQDTGYRRLYGRNPYVGYDDVRSSPFLYDGPRDGRLRPMERVDGRQLTFRFREGRFEDREAGSRWNLFGQAVQGPLRGRRMAPVVHGTYFWFAWAVFRPDTRVVQP